jgi:ATP-dependent Lhr-like helicase
MPTVHEQSPALAHFHPALQTWFRETFSEPTKAQQRAWPLIENGANTLLLAPTGSGKTLAAFLVAINRIMFGECSPANAAGVRTLYISPLKALGVDVERNLRTPIAGVSAAAQREGVAFHLPTVGVRSGDTTAADRHRLNREPPDILITTPESLFLMLTSRARDMLASVETVIVDEIHSLVATKRGAHLFVSLERLEQLRRRDDSSRAPLQRIGLSATQRPLEEVARLLGGAEATADPNTVPASRRVEIVEAGRGKQLELTIEVPVEDMSRLAEVRQPPEGASTTPPVPSIWPAIHPRLVELIRTHRSTMIFTNSRRLAERLAAAINELAGEELALAHHGSIAKETRLSIEERLKSGNLAAIVATSSLELGIDMGAVDLVIQIEAPPSIAAGIQRIGRSGHQVGAPSSGVIFPKYRGDLLACSAAAERMQNGEVEETFYARNPLDVLAQQLVAMTALDTVSVDDLYATMRGAAPFHDLPRSAFEGVLDLLAGRYPSDEFAELRPRINWDRITGEVSPRRGTQRVAILNAGTIPDRGLYGVFLPDESGGPGSRVGELDEEMVFETRAGDVFLLGASSWRVLDITHDRVLVAPAPGEPGRMPFWRGDGPGRPLEFGQAIGTLSRRLLQLPRTAAQELLTMRHGLDARAARNLLDYLHEQAESTGEVPSDQTLVVECFLDEVGDWRVAVLSPFGSRIHAPWAAAVAGRLRAETGGEVDLIWTDDGIVYRLPESDAPPPLEWLFPRADEIEDLVVRELGATAMFAARFRENAARALLLPRMRPGIRTPLWLQRRRSADLLKVAARYPNFPILLETYRECLRDVFDVTGLKRLLGEVERRAIRVRQVETKSPSPFAASLMFNYTANFIYDGDAPLAERRAQALALDHTQLRELLGDAELRELLGADVVDELALELQKLDLRYPPQDADALHELLRSLGDLTRDELSARCEPAAVASGQLDRWIADLASHRRIIALQVGGESRWVAAEDAARFRDALGAALPPGLPAAYLEPVADPLGDVVSRYARTHVPFRPEEVAARLGIGTGTARAALARLAEQERVVEGEFLPGGRAREWCDNNVLRTLKRRSLARLRLQVEPVEPAALARFLADWQGLLRPRRGLDSLLDVVEQLQGLPLPILALERDILPARLTDYRAGDLDELCAAGEVAWRGFGSVGSSDARIALYLADDFPYLAPPTEALDDPLSEQIRRLLAERGALFFEAIEQALGGFRNDLLDALWRLVWAGHLTNDTLRPLRSLLREARPERTRHLRRSDRAFRSRRTVQLPGSEGRWSLLPHDPTSLPSPTERLTTLASQLVERYGVLTREMVGGEGIVGGFAALYPVLKAMEEAGRIRRGYFVAGLGAAQFAALGADDRLRERKSWQSDDAASGVLILASADPANPYGAALPWPEVPESSLRPQRSAGSRVIVSEGAPLAWLSRTGEHLTTFLPDSESERPTALATLVTALARLAKPGLPVFLKRIDGQPASESPLATEFAAAGFRSTSRGLLHRGREQPTEA